MLTPNGAATKLGVTSQTVRLWIQEGKLPAIKVGSRYRIKEDDLSKVMAPTNDRTKDTK